MKERHDPSSKPYNKCLTCPRFRKICGGIPSRDMSLQEWCEYIGDVMYAFHLTNAMVAKGADVSLKTMEKISAMNCEQDIMRGTARRVEQFVLGPVGNHTCYIDYCDETAGERINRLLQEVEYWRKENDRKAKIIDKYLDT